METEPFELVDGPLAGQVVKVCPARWGYFPGVIYCHAPLPPDHGDEPGPRHQYVLLRGRYVHSDACACITGTHGLRPDVDTPHGRG